MGAADRDAIEAVEGLVFDVQRFSVHDGPGLRTTVFFKGCPLRCDWCDNPESQHAEPETAVFAARCMNCGQFSQTCPALSQSGTLASSAGTRSLELAGRARACPTGAVRQIGQRRSAGGIMAEVRRDLPFYREGGGLTLSGGEPLLQPELARALLRLARAAGISTALETAGHVAWDSLADCLPFVNTVLYDVKHLDQEIHRQHTGVGNSVILGNLRHLARLQAPVIVRVPLVPGFNASEDHLRALAAFVADLGFASRRMDLLPYHTLGCAKYAALGRAYLWSRPETLSSEEVASLAEVPRRYGLTVTIGG